MWPFLDLRAGSSLGTLDTLPLGDQGCTLLTSFNLDGVLGGPSADAATLGGLGCQYTHTFQGDMLTHTLSPEQLHTF